MGQSLGTRVERLERRQGAGDVPPVIDWTGMFTDDVLTDSEKLDLLEETCQRVGPGGQVRVLCWGQDEHLIPEGARIMGNGFILTV